MLLFFKKMSFIKVSFLTIFCVTFFSFSNTWALFSSLKPDHGTVQRLEAVLENVPEKFKTAIENAMPNDHKIAQVIQMIPGNQLHMTLEVPKTYSINKRNQSNPSIIKEEGLKQSLNHILEVINTVHENESLILRNVPQSSTKYTNYQNLISEIKKLYMKIIRGDHINNNEVIETLKASQEKIINNYVAGFEFLKFVRFSKNIIDQGNLSIKEVKTFSADSSIWIVAIIEPVDPIMIQQGGDPHISLMRIHTGNIGGANKTNVENAAKALAQNLNRILENQKVTFSKLIVENSKNALSLPLATFEDKTLYVTGVKGTISMS
tara:strand:+ start:738 stop:1700 length:963 start_codon:yes stop_codon:yes gene_type:complete